MEQGQWMDRAFPGEDRISELPDVIRMQILSLLSRKDAIRTGALSTKWKDLWKKRFPHPTNLKLGRAYLSDADQREIVKEIQQHMTLHGNKKIETFNLYFYPGNNYQEITTAWIEQAVVNGVEEFYLDFSQGILGIYPSGRLASRSKKFELRENVFKVNKSLSTLSLSYCRLHRNFGFRYFSSLEILYLHGINLNDHMLEKLITNCQGLEALELRECMSLRRIKVSARHLRLKILTIVHCWKIKEIDISAPMLRSFYFFGKFPDLFLFGDIPSLWNVIMVSAVRDYWPSPNNWAFMFMGLDHVQVLTLCSSGLQFIFGSGNAAWVTFENLRELQLLMDMMTNADLTDIYRFFKQCRLPLLERLFIELPISLLDPVVEYIMQMVVEDPPQLIFEHLKIIKMNNFKGHVNEIRLMEFLLRSAVNLELIILVFPHEYDVINCDADRVSLCNELMLKPRASPNAQMVMIYTSQDDHSFQSMHSEIIPGFNAWYLHVGLRI